METILCLYPDVLNSIIIIAFLVSFLVGFYVANESESAGKLFW